MMIESLDQRPQWGREQRRMYEAQNGDLGIVLNANEWEDNSWHNDACVHFWCERKRLSIYIAEADAANREMVTMARFCLSETDEDGCGIGDEPIVCTDEVDTIYQYLRSFGIATDVPGPGLPPAHPALLKYQHIALR